MVMQWPAERDIARLRLHEGLQRHLAAAHVFRELPDAGAGADGLVAIVAVQHRAAGDDDGRHVAAGRAHHQRRRGLVAAGQQHHAVERIAADRFLDIHRGQIAEQHRRRPQIGFAQRHHRKFERASRRPRRRRASHARRSCGSGRCRASARKRYCRCRSPAGRRTDRWGMPWFFIQLRCMNPSRSGLPNQPEERSLRVLSFIGRSDAPIH